MTHEDAETLARLEARRARPGTIGLDLAGRAYEYVTRPWADADDVRVLVRTAAGAVIEISALTLTATGR